MTLLFIDSFDHYATAELEDKGWSHSTFSEHKILAANGRRGTQSLFVSQFTIGTDLTHSLLDSDTMVIGAAMRWSSFLNTEAFVFQNAGGGNICMVETTTAGELRLTSGGQVRITTANIYTATDYSYYEMKYTKGTGANSFAELRKDGIVLLTITNGNATEQVSAFRIIESAGAAGSSAADDLYVLNGLGTTNNDYLGDVRIDVQHADANGAEITFSSNSGADNWTHVDDVLTDNDTTWNESGVISNRDLHTVELPTLGTEIHGIQQCIHQRKTDAGTVKVDVISEKPGGTGEKINKAAHLAADTFAYALAIRETDPDDDTTWSDAKIRANEWGYKINDIIT